MLLSGSGDPAAGPFGQGYATLDIGTNGRVTLSGPLADNKPIAQSYPLSATGRIPFYETFYGGSGSCFGWLMLLETPTSDVHGLLHWTRPAGAGGRRYPDGFAQETRLLGSRYTATSRPLLNITNAVVLLEGGNLASRTTYEVLLNAQNKIVVTPPNSDKLALVLSPPGGTFTGRFLNSGTGKPSPIKGALLQKQNVAVGFFVGTNLTGSVYLDRP